jgi:hypothetical protein
VQELSKLIKLKRQLDRAVGAKEEVLSAEWKILNSAYEHDYWDDKPSSGWIINLVLHCSMDMKRVVCIFDLPESKIYDFKVGKNNIS